MLRSDLEKIVITFDRPLDSDGGYEYLKRPSNLPEGGFHAEVVVIKEEVRLKDLLDNFFSRIKSANQLVVNVEGAWVLAAGILSLSLDLFSIKKFPDEYRSILNLLKETPRGLVLDQDKLTDLTVQNPDLNYVLDHLIDEKFLIERGGVYIVKKKILMKKNISFL